MILVPEKAQSSSWQKYELESAVAAAAGKASVDHVAVELRNSVRNLVPEALDLVPSLGFSCWFSSWGFLVLN